MYMYFEIEPLRINQRCYMYTLISWLSLLYSSLGLYGYLF